MKFNTIYGATTKFLTCHALEFYFHRDGLAQATTAALKKCERAPKYSNWSQTTDSSMKLLLAKFCVSFDSTVGYVRGGVLRFLFGRHTKSHHSPKTQHRFFCKLETLSSIDHSPLYVLDSWHIHYCFYYKI